MLLNVFNSMQSMEYATKLSVRERGSVSVGQVLGSLEPSYLLKGVDRIHNMKAAINAAMLSVKKINAEGFQAV